MAQDTNKTKARLIGELEQLRRRVVELEASGSEEKFRNIVESSPMGIHMYQLKPGNRLVFTGANPAADTILGVDNKQFIGKTIEEAFPPLIDTEVPEKYRRAAAYGEHWETEQIDYRDKMIVGAFEVHAFQTKPGAMATLFLEITQRKRAEEELRKTRNFLDNIINSMPSILIGVDAEGKVTQWNREAEKATGVPAKEAQKRTLTDVFPQMAGEVEKVRQAMKDRETKKKEKVPHKSRGETRYSDVTVFPLLTNGTEGAVIRIDDVTERIRIEEMMIQSEKMLSVGGLAAGMAHEINNPLAGVLQNAQVMRNRIFGDLARNKQIAGECGTSMEAVTAYMGQRGISQMIESIIESGRRAAQIVDNMLSFSRKSESRFAPHYLEELLEKTVELASSDYDLKKKYDFRSIEIVREYDTDVPEVLCEATKLQQVFLNILKNGAQAMTERPPDDEEKSRFILRIMRDGNMARVEIYDNGPGMDEATRKRVFEPFFTTKSVSVGSGLGLSVSYFIVTQNHGGRMSVESTPGKGANFIIHLPVERKE